MTSLRRGTSLSLNHLGSHLTPTLRNRSLLGNARLRNNGLGVRLGLGVILADEFRRRLQLPGH